MGYACPVCETPQADARHLANHLAFTAMLHGGEHEAWLDENLPDWNEVGEAELADRVTDHAEEAEYQEVFEDTVNVDGEHQHDHERSGRLFEDEVRTPGRDGVPHEVRSQESPELDEETKAIYEEAREMTEEMLGDDAADDEDPGDRDRTDETDETDETEASDESDAAGDAATDE
ncbi:DUF5810 domain-containing protein [Halomarina salina]|uniref:DUF5810 domain-containing protein n=1 Tax=Halomarina salina TaxID=1872699 RepID=A0ABD5RK36_9EURY|nr:DUF5810 domain-containing protein [Halomarina salina]